MTTDVETKAVAKALQVLDAVGAKYKIILKDGTQKGDLQMTVPVPEEKARKRTYTLAYGTYSQLIKPHLSPLEVGQVAQIPIKPYNGQRLRSAASAVACHLWGAGSHISSITKAHVEILRTA